MASMEQEYTSLSSMNIEQAPQVARSQTSLQPVRGVMLRMASSSVTRGSTWSRIGLPLTFKVIGKASGPIIFSLFAFSSSAATASTCAVAATAAEVPKVLRKERRETEKPSFDLDSLIVFAVRYNCHDEARGRVVTTAGVRRQSVATVNRGEGFASDFRSGLKSY